jgi:hypothetical protein
MRDQSICVDLTPLGRDCFSSWWLSSFPHLFPTRSTALASIHLAPTHLCRSTSSLCEFCLNIETKRTTQFNQQITHRKHCIRVCVSVCLSVCLSLEDLYLYQCWLKVIDQLGRHSENAGSQTPHRTSFHKQPRATAVNLSELSLKGGEFSSLR